MERQTKQMTNEHNDTDAPMSTDATDGVWSHLACDSLSCSVATIDEIPILDLGPLVRLTTDGQPTNDAERQELASTIASLHAACSTIGFFYIRNSGVSPELMSRMLSVTRTFFDLPTRDKLEVATQPNTPNRGYFGMEGENLGEKKRGDLKEGIDIGRVLDQNSLVVKHTPKGVEDETASTTPVSASTSVSSVASSATSSSSVSVDSISSVASASASTSASSSVGVAFQAQNRWPSALPPMRDVCNEYFRAMLRVGHTLTTGIALALGIEPQFFDSTLGRAQASLRLLHYPQQKVEDVDREQLGCGSHTDYGALTILAQTSSGLQIRSRSGRWLSAPVIPNTFIVNLADMMPRFTGGRYVSTPHRVINVAGERWSIPFFFEPALDANIRTHPSLVDPEQPDKYPPITFAQHLHNMHLKTFNPNTTKPTKLED